MVKTTIAGALVVVLASCSVEEPEQSLRVLRPPLAYQAEDKKTDEGKGSDDSQKIPVTTANSPAENAGLRADFNAP